MSFKRMPLLITLLALIFFRFYDLNVRPIHHDESVNGWFVDGMFKNGFYNYDPNNYHGPLYFYFLALGELVFGRSVEVLRSVTIFFGALLTFVPFLYRRWIGERAAWIGAFALALSPAIVFYSRYAIHEVPFALFTSVFFYYWIRAREEDFNLGNMIGLGLSLGTIACLKENFVIFLGCLCIGECMVRFYKKDWVLPKNYFFNLGALLIALIFVGLVYSAFGRDEDGVTNFFAAFNLWSHTGSSGNGHQKPFYYWLKVIGAFEWPTLLGLILAPLSLLRVNQSFRLLSVVSVGVWMAYSIVNYKTPWCLLSFQWGFVLVFSYWASEFYDRFKLIAISLMAVLAIHSGYQAYEAAYVNVDSDDNFYVYGQTFREIMQPINGVLDRVKADPGLKSTLKITVVSQFTWPLPYLFGEIKSVSYLNDSNVPLKLEGDYIFIDESLDQKYHQIIVGDYRREVYRARQWASPMVVYTRK